MSRIKGAGPVAGHIGREAAQPAVAPQSPTEMKAKVAGYRKLEVPAIDGVYDPDRGMMLIAARHPLMVGDPVVVAMDVESFFLTAAQMMMSLAVPLLHQHRAMLGVKAPDDTTPTTG